jgi:hypothetical protein
LLNFLRAVTGKVAFALPAIFEITEQAQPNGDEEVVITSENGRWKM